MSGPVDEDTIEIGDKEKTKRTPANDYIVERAMLEKTVVFGLLVGH